MYFWWGYLQWDEWSYISFVRFSWKRCMPTRSCRAASFVGNHFYWQDVVSRMLVQGIWVLDESLRFDCFDSIHIVRGFLDIRPSLSIWVFRNKDCFNLVKYSGVEVIFWVQHFLQAWRISYFVYDLVNNRGVDNKFPGFTVSSPHWFVSWFQGGFGKLRNSRFSRNSTQRVAAADLASSYSE